MYKKIFNVLGTIFLAFVGWKLFQLAFEGKELQDVLTRIKNVDWFWVALTFLISFVCHVLRAKRWQMLLKASKHPIPAIDSFNIMMLGYLVSQFIPRLGEFARAGAIRRIHNVSVFRGFGTIIFERLVDVACLFSIIGSAAILQYDKLGPLLQKVVDPLKDKYDLYTADKPYLIYIIIGGAIVLLVINALSKKKESKEHKKSKADMLAARLWAGMWSFKHVENKSLFFGYTALIWIGYYFMTYLVFFAVEETSHFTPMMGFVMVTVSSIIRNIPIAFGAAGAYHYAMSKSIMAIYDVAENPALVVATLIHGIQLMYTFIAGIASTIIILIKR